MLSLILSRFIRNPINSGVSKLSIVLLILTISACGGGGSGDSKETPDKSLDIVSVTALSRHYIVVRLGSPVSEISIDDFYIIGPDGQPLTILDAELNASGDEVLLSTQSQQEVVYKVSLKSQSSDDDDHEVKGHNGHEPQLETAIAISSTQVLLTFDERVSDGAENSVFYELIAADANQRSNALANISILAATLSDNGVQVVLDTTPMEHIEYRIRVTNVYGKHGHKRIDPTHNIQHFFGFNSNDTTPPEVLGAVPTDVTTVVVSFSEALRETLSDPSKYTITPDLTVLAAAPGEHKTRVTLTTQPQTAGTEYTVTVNDLTDTLGNPIDSTANSATFIAVAATIDKAPSVVSAISISNTQILLQFSEPVQGGLSGAENPLHFSIVSLQNNNRLPVVAASMASLDFSTVLLTTESQSGIEYKITASNIRDLSGLPIAEPSILIDPSSTTFAGTAPGATAIADSDGDGLHDHVELVGWLVYVTRANGTVETRIVNSDPRTADSDGDGINDNEELRGNMDPRNADTDGDKLSDLIEWTVVYSNPAAQDSDGDGLQDGSEFLTYGTSPNLSDTDGDQLTDAAEIASSNRNPLIADLPSPRIRVGNVNLQLDTRLSFTNQSGVQVTESKSVDTTLTRAEDETFSTSNENSTINTLGFSEQLEATVSANVSVKDASLGGSVTTTLGATQGSERGSTFIQNQASGRSSEEAFHESLTTSTARNELESISRETVGADIKVDITIDNANDIPFTIRNLELTAQSQNPFNRSQMIPIASMIPENDNLQDINIGTLGDPSRGPFVFKTVSVFPQQVENLLKNPRGLVVQLANYDIVDEHGRNFSFISQEVLDRTAGISFDMGDGRTESYRVATASVRDPNTGLPSGITMQRALSIIGLSATETIRDGGNGIFESQLQGDDQLQLIAGNPVEPRTVLIRAGDNGVIDSIIGGDDQQIPPDYELSEQAESIRDGGNRIGDSLASGDDEQFVPLLAAAYPGQIIINVGPNGVLDTLAEGDDQRVPAHRVLSRFRDVEMNVDEKRFWILYSADNRAGVDLDKQIIRAGEHYNFAYVQDKDDDGVWAREEYLHGSSDLNRDSDGDELSDHLEIRTGWRVQVAKAPQSYQVYPNPTSDDSDRDNIPDKVERGCKTDPRQRDTDLDGLTDWEELEGKLIVNGGPDGQMVSRDPDSDAITHFITPYFNGGQDGLVDHPASNSCIFFHDIGYATDPLNPDTDGDLVSDSAELKLGLNPNDPSDGPNFLDDDGDGVPNKLEREGFKPVVNGSVIAEAFTSNPNEIDSDADGLPDLLEHRLFSDPRNADTDGDGISDFNEYRGGGEACITPSAKQDCVLFKDFADNRYIDYLNDCDDADLCNDAALEQSLVNLGSKQYGTNLNEIDTDFDNISDVKELSEFSLVINNANVVVPAPSSDPLVKDTDGDGLDDGLEVSAANGSITNPRVADSDGDGVTDAREVQLETNPAQKDKRVQFAITSIIAHDTNEGGDDFTEIEGKWRFVRTIGGTTSSTTWVTMEGGFGCPIKNDGTDNVITRSSQKDHCSVKNSAKGTLIMKPGDSVTLTTEGNDFEECDGDCSSGLNEDVLNHLKETFTFDTVKSITKNINHRDEGGVLTLTTTISVIVDQ